MTPHAALPLAEEPGTATFERQHEPAQITACVLACSGARCPWQCVIAIGDAVHELVAELPVVAR